MGTPRQCRINRYSQNMATMSDKLKRPADAAGVTEVDREDM